MRKEIIKEPNNILHQKCKLVTDFNEAKKIADELLTVIRSLTKWWNRWLGFAANQIGYNKRIIVLRNSRDKYDFFVNPTLKEKRMPFFYPENCFSLDLKNIYLVKRYLWTKVRYQDLEGVWHEKTLRGFSGIYQEIDHLDGILVSEIGWRIL